MQPDSSGLITVRLRPESPQDEPFIRRVVIETVASELGASAWPEPMRSHLLGIQYTARRASHRLNYPEAVRHVIQADGASAGWVVVATTTDEIRIVDIMILPEMRGRGIGTATLREILSIARGQGKPVLLNVNLTNHGAIRLYERLGFRRIRSDEVQLLMEASLVSIVEIQ